MTIIGTVRNGKIELPQGGSLPEGTEVSVEITEVRSPIAAESKKNLLKFAGSITDLPEDSSVNVDHYLYGKWN